MTPPGRDPGTAVVPLAICMAAAAAASILAALVAARIFALGPVDDAYISLRFASNWAAGAGLSFNPGQIIEGYTNFLVVLLEMIAVRAGVAPVVAMQALGLASLGLLAAVVAGFARTVCGTRTTTAAVWGVLAALHPAVLCWSLSGMETVLAAALQVAVLWSALILSGRRAIMVTSLLVVLAGMARPDAVIILPAACLAVAVRGRSWKPAALLAAAATATFGLYFAARGLYFGALFPNTFYAKLDYGNAALARRGVHYVLAFARVNPLLLAAGLAATVLHVGHRRRRPPLDAVVLLLAATLHAATIIYEGGDHFSMYRFMVPVVPLLTLAALHPLHRLMRRPSGVSTAAPAMVLALILAAAGAAGAALPRPTGHFARHVMECRLARQWSIVGRWLRAVAPPGESVATVAIGAIGYHSSLEVIDPHGLIDAAIGRMDWDLGHGYAGHEKYDVGRVLARRPGYILVIHFPTGRPLQREELPASAWGRFNKEILASPVLRDEYEYRSVKVEDFYMNLFVRRGLPLELRP